MITKKSKSLKTLEKISRRSLSLSHMLESIREGEEESLAVFAKKLGISASHLCDIEKGRKVVSPSRAAQFAKSLGYSESQFIRFAIQDDLSRHGLNFKISVERAS